MTLKRYYRLAIWVPLVAPWALLPYIAFADSLPESLARIAGLVVWSPVVAGLPYVLFAWYKFSWMRDTTTAEIRRAVWWAPICFVPWFVGFYVMWQIVAVFSIGGLGENGLEALAVGLGFCIALILLFGYGYAVAVEGFRWLVSRWGCLEADAARDRQLPSG